MRVAILLVVLVFAIGCGSMSQAPTFKTESEELSYLESQSNPSVDQFRRREELRTKIAQDRTAAIAEAAKRDRQAKIDRLMNTARDYESKGLWTLAAKRYQEVVEKYPDSPEAEEAEAFIAKYKAMPRRPASK